jgi:hypothetical protein
VEAPGARVILGGPAPYADRIHDASSSGTASGPALTALAPARDSTVLVRELRHDAAVFMDSSGSQYPQAGP